MSSRPVRFIALLLLASDRHRLAATVLAPILFALSFGGGYLQALTVGVTDVLTPVDQPPVATIDHGSISLTAPQPTGAGLVVARAADAVVDPLNPVHDRAPPALIS
jgi:hypothetical protein